MSERRPEHFLWICALVALGAGCLLAVISAQRTADNGRLIKAQGDYMQQLARIRSRSARDDAAVRMFESLTNAHPLPIEQLLEKVLPGRNYESREPPPRKTLEGWTARQLEVTFGEIELTNLAAFVSHAESLRPPWRVTACTVQVAPRTQGMARAVLTLEALDKAP